MMGNFEHETDSPQLPPPLIVDRALDDEQVTVPVDAPWVAPPSLQDTPPKPPVEKPALDIPAKQNLLTKALVAGSALILILAAAIYFTPGPETDETTKQSPHDSAHGSSPPIADKPVSKYNQVAREIEERIMVVAGSVGPTMSLPHSHQNIEELLKDFINENQTPFSEEVRKHIPEAFADHPSDEPYPYHVLWTVGQNVTASIASRISHLETIADERPDNAGNNRPETYEKWLTKWLLGTNGLYCQLRDRYWEQVKTGHPPISPRERKKIGDLRHERRKLIIAAGYPKKPMYNYCEKQLLSIKKVRRLKMDSF